MGVSILGVTGLIILAFLLGIGTMGAYANRKYKEKIEELEDNVKIAREEEREARERYFNWLGAARC